MNNPVSSLVGVNAIDGEDKKKKSKQKAQKIHEVKQKNTAFNK